MSLRQHNKSEEQIKQGFLMEVTHWKNSAKRLLEDVDNKLKTLTESKASAKREINVSVAKLEEQMKKLEQRSLQEMRLVAEREESAVRQQVRNIQERLSRLERTESSLSDNMHGDRLTKAIQEGREQVTELKGSVLDINRNYIPTKAEFELIPTIAKIFQSKKLGDTSFMTSSDVLLTTTITYKGNQETKQKSTFVKEEKRAKLTEYEHSSVDNDPRDVTVSWIDQSMDTHDDNDDNDDNDDSKANDTTDDYGIDEVEILIQEDPDKIEDAYLLDDDDLKSVLISHIKQKAIKSAQGQRSRASRAKVIQRLSRSASEKERGNDLNVSTVHYLDNELVKEKSSFQEEGGGHLGGHISTGYTSTHGAGEPHMRSFRSPTRHLYMKSYFPYKGRFQSKQHADETDQCRLTGIAVLNDGKILVTDVSHLQVMLYNYNFKFIYGLDCPSPFDATVVSHVNNMVAVSCYHGRKVILLKAHEIFIEKLKEVKVTCSSKLYGVAYKADHLYVLCHRGDVHVVDTMGQQLRTIRTRVGGGNLRYLDADVDGRRVYVSGDGAVTCYLETGREEWQFFGDTGHTKFSPGGLTLYHGRLFVTDWHSQKVVELSLDGVHVRDVIIDNVEFPQAVGILQTSGTMYITQSNKFKQEARGRSIKVFEIK